MLTIAIVKLAFFDHSPTALVALLLALAFLVMLEMGFFDMWH